MTFVSYFTKYGQLAICTAIANALPTHGGSDNLHTFLFLQFLHFICFERWYGSTGAVAAWEEKIAGGGYLCNATDVVSISAMLRLVKRIVIDDMLYIINLESPHIYYNYIDLLP